MLYRNMKAMLYSTDGITNFFNNVAGAFQRDKSVPCMFIICLDYISWISIDLIKENGLIQKKARSRWYPVETMIDADYADDQVLLTNTHA